MSRKIIAAAAALILLSGCSKAVNGGKLDYGYVEGYFSELAYEVRTEDGTVTERMYVLGDEKDFTEPIGRKDVYFDADTGEMTDYTVNIGEDDDPELVISFKQGNGSSYYTEVHYAEDGRISSVNWENYFPNEDGETVHQTGEETYYPGSNIKKTFTDMYYLDGELIDSQNITYDAEGKPV